MKLLLLFASLYLTFMLSSQTEQLKWSFLHPIENKWIEAGTHGSVQQTFIETGALPDPFYGLNEEKFGWIENYKWEFASKFFLTEDQFIANNLELEFPGIDTYADVYLNDVLLFSAENCFKPYRAQIKKLVQVGYNNIKVIFTPPVMYHEKRYNSEKFHYPATNDVGKVAIASLTRKPQYQFGWDWALRMNTIGFLKPVVLHHYETSRIIGKSFTTINLSDSLADLDLEVSFTIPLDGSILWKSQLFGDQILECQEETILSRSVTLQNPKLWWPRGQGKQDMYVDKWFFYNQSGKIIDSIDVRFGVRKTELIIEPDQWGTSYFVKFNNRPIFCKGADYIPQDIFPTRVKDTDIQKLVDVMADCNFNMVRVWGGGYYPDEVFYEACDEKGIMVWQDLMFACAMYPGDSLFLNNVRGELEYQIPRISGHPSLTLFNGNNEVDVAWKNWGFQLKYGIYGADARQVEDDYNRLFKQLAPTVISSFTNTPYVHTSPLSNWGKDEYYNHASMHYWGVWHGKDPIEDFGKKSGRFNAEYGFQSFPEYSTLSTFSKKEDWSLESDVMKHHQKSYVGNGMILKQATILYCKPRSFEEFVYYSQLTQSKAISIAIAGHRTGMPKCMGTLYWQLNDCWQAPTWSSIDYFGNWKALQYSVKKDYEDVAVVSKIEELGKETYFIVSDSPETFMCDIKYTLYHLNGKVQSQKTVSLAMKQGSVEQLCLECLSKEKRKKSYVIHFEWNDAYGNKKERWVSHIGREHKKAEVSTIKYSLENINTKEKTATLVIDNDKLLLDFWVSSNQLGVTYDTNFIDFIPGKHSINITYTDDVFTMDNLMFYWR